MISIMRYLFSPGQDELAPSLLRMCHLLLQGIRLHAIEGEPHEYAKFQGDVERLETSLGERPSPSEALVVTGSAIQAMEDYNRRAARFLKAQAAELHQIVSMLTRTLAEVSAARQDSVNNLQSIEKHLESAALVEDMRALKLRLSDCLRDLQAETAHQREEAARLVTALKRGEEPAPADGLPPPPKALIDPATRLPGREQAEEALRATIAESSHSFAALFVVDRLDLMNTRYGYAVGDQVLDFFIEYIGQALSRSDRVFRWNRGILALIERNDNLSQVKAELARIVGVRLEKTVELQNRTVLLPVTCAWSVLPVFGVSRPETLFEQLDELLTARRRQPRSGAPQRAPIEPHVA